MWTIDEMARKNAAAGGYWFTPGATQFFKTKYHVVAQGPGGVFFVTSEQPPQGVRRWSLRQWNPETCTVSTVGEFMQYRTLGAAEDAAEEASRYPIVANGREE